MKRFGCWVLFAVLATVLIAALAPAVTADSDQSDPRVIVTEPGLDSPEIKIGANSSFSFNVVFFNTNPYLKDDFTDDIWISVKPTVLTSDGNEYDEATASATIKGSVSEAV